MITKEKRIAKEKRHESSDRINKNVKEMKKHVKWDKTKVKEITNEKNIKLKTTEMKDEPIPKELEKEIILDISVK